VRRKPTNTQKTAWNMRPHWLQ